jgi:PIN domain nuclease of toxin-antitoxin system
VLLLLDTHVWVWNVDGDTRGIGRRTRALIGRAEAGEAVRISPVSLFEIAALHTAGRLRLAQPIGQWVEQALEISRARIAAFSPTVGVDAGQIPRTALADPLDRLLVATARQLDATLLTGDARILDYASQTGNVRVSDARR